MGEAILHHLTHQSNHTLEVHSSMFETDEIPVDQLFRKLTEMPAIEQRRCNTVKATYLTWELERVVTRWNLKRRVIE